jgi:parallel beta helix pectate lyase-like protein
VRHSRLLFAVLCSAAAAAGALPAAASAVPTTIAASACTKFASPTGSDSASGSLAAPYATAQKLVSSLGSGQIGCLRAGTYTQDVSIANAGITLTAYQGEQATLVGRLYVRAGADNVTVTGLNLDGKNANALPSPTVNGNGDRFVGDEVTNENTEICFVIGSGYGRAQSTLIQGNRIHNCGKLPSDNQDHGIYVADADNTQILDNVIYDNVDRGIQLYPDAQGTVIRGNVIDGNGEGIIFSGNGGTASSNTTVESNLITNATIRSDVESWYPTGNPVGTGNVVQGNCVVPGVGGSINTGGGGFTATGNLVVSDALYVNRSSGDFQLSSNSPCLSAIQGSTAPVGSDWSTLSAITSGTTTSSGSTTTTSGSTTTSSGSTTTTSGSTTTSSGGTTGTKGHKKLQASTASVRHHRRLVVRARHRRRARIACHVAPHRQHRVCTRRKATRHHRRRHRLTVRTRDRV